MISYFHLVAFGDFLKFFNKVPDKFFISLFLLMNFLGILVYLFGGEYYRVPSAAALAFLSASVFVVAAAYFTFAVIVFFVPDNNFLLVGKRIFYNREDTFLKIFFVFSIFCCLLFFIYNIKSFPYWGLFASGEPVGESSRPDVVGNIPFYWSFSIILDSFALPALVHALSKELKDGGRLRLKIFWTCSVVFFSFMMGNKSGLISVLFFFLFFLFRPSLFKIFVFVFGFVVIYFSIKYAYYAGDIWALYEDLGAAVESIFRRVVMINVSAAGYVWDSLILSRGDIDSFNNLKQYTFYGVYGYLPGGATVIFHTEIVYLIGSIAMAFVAIYFFVIFCLFIRYFSYRFFAARETYFLVYFNFYGAIILATGSFLDFIARYLIPIFCIALVYSVSVFCRRLGFGVKDNLSSRSFRGSV